MSTAAASDPEDSLCIGCGFCCDGTLHGTTELSAEDDGTTARAVGLDVIDVGGSLGFAQPCSKFACGICTIYADRPGVCRTYRCKLLKDVDEGRIGKAEAREKIQIARTLIAAIASPEGRTSVGRAALSEALKGRLSDFDDAERPGAARTLLNIGLVEHFFDRWFRHGKTPPPPKS